MSKPLVGRHDSKRVILWGRVWSRGLDAAIAALVLFSIVTCAIGASTEGPFFETWWGRHLLSLLLGFPALAVTVAAVLPVLRWLRLPLDRLPALDAPPDSSDSVDPVGQRDPRRRAVVMAAIAAVPVLVALFYVEENWRGERAWRQYRQEQEAHGENFDRFSLVPPPVVDKENFAMTPYLAQSGSIQPLSPLYDAAAARLKPRNEVRFNSWVLAQTDLLAWYAAFTGNSEPAASADEAAKAFARRYGLRPAGTVQVTAIRPPTPGASRSTTPPTLAQAAASVLTSLAEAGPVLKELRAASSRPHSRFNLDYDNENPALILLPHYGPLKSACQVLQLRASAELALGRTASAFDDINLIFRLTEATRNEPFLLSLLVRVSETHIGLQPLAEGLARHQWSEPQLRALEEGLGEFDFLADGRKALQAERIFGGNGIIDYVRRSSNRYQALTSGNGGNSSFNWEAGLLAIAPSGWFYLEKLNYNRVFQDYLLPTIDVPDHKVSPGQCSKAEAQIGALCNHPGPVLVLRHRFFFPFLLPSLASVAQKLAFTQTGTHAAMLACVLERYRLAHRQFPETLDALVPQFIAQVPHDVITGQALKYCRTSDGQYLLYSVGWNQEDDGGVLRLTQSGMGIRRTEGDWVWQLPAQP